LLGDCADLRSVEDALALADSRVGDRLGLLDDGFGGDGDGDGAVLQAMRGGEHARRDSRVDDREGFFDEDFVEERADAAKPVGLLGAMRGEDECVLAARRCGEAADVVFVFAGLGDEASFGSWRAPN
jgi:hypothetical protein